MPGMALLAAAVQPGLIIRQSTMACLWPCRGHDVCYNERIVIEVIAY